jgi:hypothetical protein
MGVIKQRQPVVFSPRTRNATTQDAAEGSFLDVCINICESSILVTARNHLNQRNARSQAAR